MRGAYDLLIGGSPCQGFSFAGKQLNFQDPRSKLFFEYVRILKECRKINPNIKFLLENVRMKKEYEDVITDILGVIPIKINSSFVSAQERKRLYWTNINNGQIPHPENKNITTKDIIDYENKSINSEGWMDWWEREKDYQLSKKYSRIINNHDKSICMTARQISSWNGNLVESKNGLRFISPVEAERLQTLPDNYTEGISNTQRYKSIGNGWTVDVVAHIFSFL